MLKLENIKELKSTITGLIGLGLTAAVLLGYFSEEQSIELTEAIGGIVSGVFSILAMFVRPESKTKIK